METDRHRACQITAISPLQRRDTADHSPGAPTLHKMQRTMEGAGTESRAGQGEASHPPGCPDHARICQNSSIPVAHDYSKILQNPKCPKPVISPKIKKPSQSSPVVTQEKSIASCCREGWVLQCPSEPDTTGLQPTLVLPGTEEFSQPFPATCFSVS